MLATPLFIDVIAPGFHGDTRTLTIDIVRVLFPGTGLLVLSAWCLGVLNSHRRFLLSYASGVMWNVAMIATLLMFGGRTSLPTLAVYLGWGSVVGSALQFAVQLPFVLRLAPDLRIALDTASARRAHGRAELRAGVRQPRCRPAQRLHRYAAGHVAAGGAVAALSNATTLTLLPVSLFGMAVSAAELPAMSGAATADGDGAEAIRLRLDAGLRRIAFFVVPSAMAFLALGDVVAGALLQTGRFVRADAQYVWAILAGSAVGLLAQTLGRLYSSTYYALRDTRTPLRYAVVRVALTTVLGYAVRVLAAGPAGHRTAVGRGGTHGVGRRGRLGGDADAAPHDERAYRAHGPAGVLRREALDRPRSPAPRLAGAIKIALPPLHPVVGGDRRPRCRIGLVYFGMTTRRLGVAESRRTVSVRLQAVTSG